MKNENEIDKIVFTIFVWGIMIFLSISILFFSLLYFSGFDFFFNLIAFLFFISIASFSHLKLKKDNNFSFTIHEILLALRAVGFFMSFVTFIFMYIGLNEILQGYFN